MLPEDSEIQIHSTASVSPLSLYQSPPHTAMLLAPVFVFMFVLFFVSCSQVEQNLTRTKWQASNKSWCRGGRNFLACKIDRNFSTA